MTETVTLTPEPVGEASSPTVAVENTSEAMAPIENVAPEITITPEVMVEAKPTETILGSQEQKVKVTEKAPIEIKISDSAETKAEEPTKQEDSQSDEPAPLPTYEEFTAPEDFTLDSERLGDFTNALAEFETKTKADHAEVQALGQSLIERHVAEVKNAVKHYTKSLMDQFETQKSVWKETFESDPEIGGNRKDTTVSAALEFIRTHGGTHEQQTEFHQLMEQTGVGNHPAMIRMLAKANMAMAEGKPLAATAPMPQSANKIQKRYGTN